MYPPIGRYEDLAAMIARAELPLRASAIPQKGPLGRSLIELPFQTVGISLAALLDRLPSDFALSIEQSIYKAIVGEKDSFPFDDKNTFLAEASALQKEALNRSGVEPAILVAFVHAPVLPETRNLNVELFRQALLAARAIRGRACRTKLIGAVDAYALDMLALHEEGAYVGMIASRHLGIDRMPLLRPPGLVSQAAWPGMPHRIAAHLLSGAEALMVLGGGIETTARLLYALRETVGELCRKSSLRSRPDRIRDALSGVPSFQTFAASSEIGSSLRRSLWRELEAWVLHEAIKGEGFSLAARGEFQAEKAFLAAGAALGYEPGFMSGTLSSFKTEFARATPYRERFFRDVSRTVLEKGRPVVMMPLVLDELRPRWERPVLMLGAGKGMISWVDAGKEGTGSVGEFAREVAGGRFG